jgi:hypothetical protein
MDGADTPAATGGRLHDPSLLRLILLCAAQFMLIVDVVVVNVALPTIRADLTIPDSRLALVSVGYTLTFGSLLIVFGRAGDLFGRRRLFLIGLLIFTAHRSPPASPRPNGSSPRPAPGRGSAPPWCRPPRSRC